MRSLRLTLTLFVGALLTLAGCRHEEDIIKETVEHPDREPIRLRVAVMERADSVWFFRMSGPVDLVAAHEKTFEEFVRSVSFDEDEAKWTEPKGWKKDPKGKERYAGFRIDAKPKEMEIAVTRLPLHDDGFDLMKNMHRWQKQVHVPLTENHKDLDKEVKRDKVGAQAVTWVDLRGLGVHTVSKPPEPMAAGNPKKFLPGAMLKKKQAAVAAQGDKLPFTYDIPAGWVKKPPRQFILAAFEVKEGNQSAELTLSTLGGSVGGNIKRWRDQVGLPEVTDAEAERQAIERQVAGRNAYYVDLFNKAAGQKRILGIVIPMGRESLFIKMTGPHEVIGKHMDEFEAFVKSFKIEK